MATAYTVELAKRIFSCDGIVAKTLEQIPLLLCGHMNERGEWVDADEVHGFTPIFHYYLGTNWRIGDDYMDDNVYTNEDIRRFPFYNGEEELRPDILITTADNTRPILLAEIKMSGNPEALHDLEKLTFFKSHINKDEAFCRYFFIYVNMSLEDLLNKIKNEHDIDYTTLNPNIDCFCLKEQHVQHIKLRELIHIINNYF